MERLPVELLHYIFDKLDVQTIIFSMRSLSKLFRSAVHSYDRFTLNMKSISKAHFHVFCRLIKPENMISLTLSNDECATDQIDLFISLIDLRRLTRLRSLTLLHVDEGQLIFILKQINLNLLTSFTFGIRKYDYRRRKTTNNVLQLIMTQQSLRRFEFDIISHEMTKFSWPSNCTIQYLTIKNAISIDYLVKILQYSPHLHTISIKTFDRCYKDDIPIFNSFQSFPQLISLTIENLTFGINTLESFLLMTPSLVYLKLIKENSMVVDGKRWEEFIQTNLLRLDKFEFLFAPSVSIQSYKEDFDLILASFQTPFWTECKKWFVTGKYGRPFGHPFHLYSIPICLSFLPYRPNFEELSEPSYSKTIVNETTIRNNAKSLAVKWDKQTTEDIQKKRDFINHPLFSQVTEIDLELNDEGSSLSFLTLSVLIDISKIVKMTLTCFAHLQYANEKTLRNIGEFFKELPNLSSLFVHSTLNKYHVARTFDTLYPFLPCQLKHLQISINTVAQVKQILEKCQNLSTIKFNMKTKFCDEIIQWLNNNTINSTCKKGNSTISLWLGKINMIQSSTIRVDSKKIKLMDV